MPELPEVEMVRGAIAPRVCGRAIERAQLADASVCGHPGPERFVRAVCGRTITSLARRGKFLRFCLDCGELVVHLRMTGVLMACPPDFPAEPHTRAVLDLSGGMQLRFADVRRFGRLWLIDAGEVDDFTGMDRLGAEPFDPCVTGAWLKERLGRSSRAVKTCLLDQTAVCGIGNIYSDEILFAARIHPQRPARSLTAPEWKRLAQTTKELMSFHVERTRASPEEYLRTRGREYRNTPFLRVYGHAGEACPVCGTKLERAVIGGRSSVYCPKCQMRRAERDRP